MSETSVQTLDFPALRNRNYPIHKAADRLEPYLRAIVEKIQPEKIILFGSYAYGVPKWDSDFDLLVVRKGISSPKDSNIEIRTALWGVGSPRPAFTFLSITPEGYEEKLRRGSFIYSDIANKGLVLYAA